MLSGLKCLSGRELKKIKKVCSVYFFLTILLTIMIVPHTCYAATVSIDGNGAYRTFYGVGMANTSGTSKLLKDYPANQQSDILDLLFKPKFGASFQVVKNEIGGDFNSSSGTEPSHWRNQGDTPVARGVNFWISSQAKSRNTDIRFMALRWAKPSWVSSDGLFKDYLLKYIDLMAANGTPLYDIDPAQNEAAYSSSVGNFIKNTFKPALDNGGYTTKIVISDEYQTWNAATAVQSDPALKSAVYALASHYIYSSSTDAQNSGLPLFASEATTPLVDDWNSIMSTATCIAQSFSTGKMSLYMLQPALDCVYDTIQYQHKGILTANTPWSGHYDIRPGLWMVAQFTQFSNIGWKILDNGSGSVNTNNYYVTFKDPSSSNYSMVLTNNGSSSTSYTFNTTNLSTATLNVWGSDSSTQFIKKSSITPSGGSFSVTVPANSVYSLTTTSGQQKGTPTYSILTDSNMSLPYTENFENYSLNAQPKYFHDQNGAFEVVDNGAGGKCLKQVITSVPNGWGNSGAQNPYTIMGEGNLANYQVSSDVKLPSTTDYASVVARVNIVDPGTSTSYIQPQGYWMSLGGGGNWVIKVSTGGTVKDLATGTIAGYNNSNWHNVKLKVNGTTITAYVDGTQLANVTDTTFASGQVALACNSSSGWRGIMYDNFKIETIDAVTPDFITKLDDRNSTINYSGSWSNDASAGWQDLNRTLKSSSQANAYLQTSFNGSEVSIVGRKKSGGGTADIYIDGVFKTTINTSSTNICYRNALYSTSGLSTGSHTIKLVVKTGTITVDFIQADSFGTIPVSVNDNTSGTGNNQFDYSGTWSYGSQSGAYQNDNHWRSIANDYYQVRFNGTQISIYTAIAPNEGIAAISIDGGTETNIDFYSATRRDQVLMYTSPILASGQHTLKVRLTGMKNASSSSTIVVADRVDIIN